MKGSVEIDVRVPLDRFELSVSWTTSESSLALFGPSGSGKTTVLETLAGLRPGARGLLRIHGKTWLDSARGVFLPAERRGVGYVPQELLLFPHLDVRGNLLAGHRRASRADSPGPSIARVIDVLELEGLEARNVDGLSGGEKRRVALGRALCSGPELLLLDEPLSGLDTPLRDRVTTYLLRVREEFAVPTILVSHDATEVKLLSRETAILRAGRIVRTGPPDDIFLDPETLEMVLGEGFENLLRGEVIGVDGGAARVLVEPGIEILVRRPGAERGDTVQVGLRAEDLILAVRRPEGLSAQNVIPGTVRELRATGDRVFVVVEVGHARVPLAVTITPRALHLLSPALGDAVFLVWKAHAARVWRCR